MRIIGTYSEDPRMILARSYENTPRLRRGSYEDPRKILGEYYEAHRKIIGGSYEKIPRVI